MFTDTGITFQKTAYLLPGLKTIVKEVFFFQKNGQRGLR